MSRRPTTRLPPTAGPTNVERLDMQQFARKLHHLMIERGLSQSDVARKIWGSKKNPDTGHSVAINRDRISCWVRGTQVPDPQNLLKLSEALGVPVDELAPDIMASAVDREHPELAIQAVSGSPDTVHLVVTKLVPLAVAAKVASLLAGNE